MHSSCTYHRPGRGSEPFHRKGDRVKTKTTNQKHRLTAAAVLGLLLVVVLMLSLLTMTASAANNVGSGSGTWISGKLTYSFAATSEGTTGNGAKGVVSVSGSTLTVSATSSKFVDGGCNADTHAFSTTTTVTVTNASTYPLKITSMNAASVNVTGASQGEIIAPGATFNIAITSNPNSSSDTTNRTATGTVTIAVEEQTSVEITLAPSPYVSYTVNGLTVAQNGSNRTFTADVGATYALPTITAPAGYEFKGWRVGSELINASSFKANGAYTVFPAIVVAGTDITAANFKVGSNTYAFWEDAVSAAVNVGGTVFVNLAEVTLPDNVLDNLLPAAGGTYVKPSGTGVEYLLPSGVSLVLPYNTSTTVHTTTPDYDTVDHVTPYAFRTLTVPNGAKISVYGSVNVDSFVSAIGTGGGGKSWNATPSGPHGKIVMKSGSEMTFNSGSNLYCYGYINGDGTITVKSGAKVYELFQDRAWRGGSATSDMEGNGYNVFPLPMYYVQNVEAPMILYKGATEFVWTVCNMSGGPYASNQIEFIGTGGMFKLTGSNSDYITKRYHANVDRLEVAAHGNMTLNALNVKITGLPIIGSIEINSSDYVLPINNMEITVETGTTSIASTQKYGVAFLPGAKMTVKEGATFNVNAPTYFYDVDEWGLYGTNGEAFVPVGYSTANGANAIRSAANLEDAELDVNGTVTVGNKLYTTASGAHITSSAGTGVLSFTTEAETGTKTTYQAIYANSAISYEGITVNNAWLLNGDESYSETVSTGTSKWYYDKDGEHWYRYTVDFALNGTNVARDYYCENNDTVVYDASWLENLGASVTSGTATTAISGTNVNVTGVTTNSVVTLTGTPKEYVPTFVLSESEYGKYQLYTGGTLNDTVTIDGATYYVVQRGATALAVGSAVAAPADADLGVTPENHNGITWNMSGVSATSGNPFKGVVTAGPTAGGPSYIYGFYSGVVAYNSWSDAYYTTLLGAFEVLPQDVDATITLLADCGTFEEESGISAYIAYPSNNITLDLNGHHAVGRIVNQGTFTLELNGGTLDYHTGATVAAATYKSLAAVTNSGTMTIQDSVGGGKITTDAISNDSGANGSAVIRNNAGGTLTVTGKDAEHLLPLEHTQTVNANNYGIFNLGTITALTNVDITTAQSGTVGINIYNTQNGKITQLSGSHLNCYSNYSIFNYGGQIGTISGVNIDGFYGINNRNVRGSNTIANGYNIAYYGTIGTITDVTMDVMEFGVYNGGVIDEISGHTVITATPDQPYDDTPSSTRINAKGEAYPYAILNSANWWYDTAVWKRTDSTVTRTDTYKEEEAYRPRIKKITGDVELHGVNTGKNADYGYTLYNAGVIDEISGNVSIESHAHASNSKTTASNYTLINTNGGIIKEIGGNVNVTASNRAMQNSSVFTLIKVVVSSGTAAKPTTYGGQTLSEEYTYGAPSKIGAITGGTYSAASTYALYNSGTVGDITNASFSAVYNVLYNETAVNSYYYWYKVFADGADKYTANTDYQRVYTYTRNMSKSGVIGTISGGSITATGAGYQAVYNVGYIEALKNMTISTPTGKATSKSTYYPLVFNSDSRIAGCDYTYTTEYNGTDAYVTLYEWDYTYGGSENPATINLIENVTMTNPQDYTIRNLGYINTIKDSTISAGTLNTIANNTGHYETRKSYRYYSGATPFSTTKNVAEVTYDYTRVQPYIGLLDGNTIAANGTTYAINNAGHIGTIKNNTITSKTTNTIYNAGYVVTECHSNVNTLRGVTAVAATSLTNNYDTTENAKVESYAHVPALIDCIGEGNTITGTYNTITNAGKITAIDSGEGTPSQITGTTRAALYNYIGIVGTKNRTATLTAANANASYTDVNTYIPAEIGTIKHTYFQGGRNVLINGSGDANYDPVKITEIGEGAEFYNGSAAYDVVSNNAAYAQIEEISGGIFRNNKSGAYYAIKNNSTAYPILLSGGDFRNYTTGSDTGRARAVYKFDDPTYITYPEGKYLSSATNTRTPTGAVNSNVNVAGYYYITDVFTVTFNMQEHGDAIGPITNLESGSKISAPDPAPTADGWTFGGWYKEEACTTAWNFDTDTVTENTTLYAKWTVTVTFDMQGHGTQIDPITGLAPGSTITAPTAPSETGWTFGGWYTDEACTDGNEFNFDTVISTNITLYAKWTVAGYHVSVEDYVTDGDGGYDFETSLTAGSYTDVTFTVYCEKACIVLWAPDSDDEDLTRVIGEEVDDDTYEFTIEGFTEDITVYIILKGDVDMNGEVDADDVDMIEQSTYSPRNPAHIDLEVLEEFIADVDQSDEVDADDVDIVEQSTYSPRNPNYAAITWDEEV